MSHKTVTLGEHHSNFDTALSIKRLTITDTTLLPVLLAGKSMSVLAAYFPLKWLRAFLGKGGLFVLPPLKAVETTTKKTKTLKTLTWLTGSSTRAETGCINLQHAGSSVTNCQALT